jgi:hypothetical protein
VPQARAAAAEAGPVQSIAPATVAESAPAAREAIDAVATVRRPLLDAVALRLRGTGLGRVLVQVLPQGVVARLRARLS